MAVNNKDKSKRVKSHYPKNTVELARNIGHTVSRLLWTKILASSTPAVQEMLITFLALRDALHLVIPEEYEVFQSQPIDHKQLAQQIQKAERLLTTSDTEPDIPGQVN